VLESLSLETKEQNETQLKTMVKVFRKQLNKVRRRLSTSSTNDSIASGRSDGLSSFGSLIEEDEETPVTTLKPSRRRGRQTEDQVLTMVVYERPAPPSPVTLEESLVLWGTLQHW